MAQVLSDKLKEAREIVTYLESERQATEDERFRDISEWILPHRGFWPADSDSKAAMLDRGKKIINPAGTLAVERAAGGMTTGLTPEGQPWFGFSVRDQKLMEAPGVREYLDYCENIIYAGLRMGDFYSQIQVNNQEIGGFGNMLLFQDFSPKTLMRFEACTCGTYCVALSAEGELDTVVRRLRWPARYLVNKFGKEKVSKRVLELMDTSPYTKVDVIHLVRPNEKRDSGKIDNRNMPFESLIFEASADTDENGPTDVLSQSGYHEMPYHFAWWTRAGDSDYGLGTGHLLLGHVKQLQEMERQKLIAVQKMVNPPVRKPSGFKGRLNTAPGGENAIGQSDSQGVGTLYEINIHVQELMADIEKVEARIAAVAKADLFYDLPAEMRPKDMTATEYMERKRERLQLIAPVVSVYEPRVLDKVIERAYAMFDRAGLFPPPPPALVEAGHIMVDYISTVAKALRQAGVESTRALVLDVSQMAQIQASCGLRPTVLYKVDMAQAIDEIAEGLGVPSRVIRDDKAYEKLMAEDDAKQAQAMQAQQQADAAGKMAQLANVKTDGTIAGKVMEAQQQ